MTCPTCTRPADAPYRRMHDGRIVEGCIDACHGARLKPGTPSHDWHFRPSCVAWRDKQAARLAAMLA